MEEELLGMLGSFSLLPPMARLALLRPRAAARVPLTLTGLTHAQALWRGHAARLSYRQQRAAAVAIQQRWRATLAMQGARARFGALRRRVVVAQAAARRWLARRARARGVRAVGVVQRWGRMALARRRYGRQRAAVVRVQALWRGRRAKGAYAYQRRGVMAVQAAVRGVLARGRGRAERAGRVAAMRAHAFALWRLARTPLVDRTRLWALRGEGFLPLAVWGEECGRLWEELGLVEAPPAPRLCLAAGSGGAFDARMKAVEAALPSLLLQLQSAAPVAVGAMGGEEAAAAAGGGGGGGGGWRGSRGRSSAVSVGALRLSHRFSLALGKGAKQAVAAVEGGGGSRPLSSSSALGFALSPEAAARRLEGERRRVYAALKAQR